MAKKGNFSTYLMISYLNVIEPSYAKEGLWLQSFEHSNLLYMHAMRAITNHALIDEYRLRFLPNKEFKCSCGVYPIESKRHILYECRRFNKY